SLSLRYRSVLRCVPYGTNVPPMELPHPSKTFPQVIDRHRIATGRSFRDLADETLIPLSTLHRKMHSGDFTMPEVARLAAALQTTPSALMAEAEAEDVAA